MFPKNKLIFWNEAGLRFASLGGLLVGSTPLGIWKLENIPKISRVYMHTLNSEQNSWSYKKLKFAPKIPQIRKK